MSAPVIVGVTPHTAPVVEIGIGDRYDADAVAALWGSARWSTPGPENEWAGQEPLWADVTCDVLEQGTYTGHEGSTTPFDVGTATIVVRNADGWADYNPPDDDDAALLTVRPGRQIRIGVALAGGATRWLWRGVIDVVENGYDPVEGEIATIGCVDAKGDAGRPTLPLALSKVGAGDFAYQRVARILDQVRWPKWRRALQVDNVAMGATGFGRPVADEMDRTADSASGHVHGDIAGNVAFRRKDWMVWGAEEPPAATIGNVDPADICPSRWEVRFGREDITTRVIAGREGETPLVVDDPEAIGLYGVETWERVDLLPVANFELSRIASRVLSVRNDKRMPRIVAVTLDARTGDGEVAALLSVASPYTPTRLRCRHVGDDGRLVFDRTMMVTGIEHTLSPAEGWTARVALDDAMPYRQVTNPARWSDPDTRWSTDDRWALSL